MWYKRRLLFLRQNIKFDLIFLWSLSFLFPFPKVGNAIFHSRSQKLGIGWAIPVPVPKVQKSFPLTPGRCQIRYFRGWRVSKRIPFLHFPGFPRCGIKAGWRPGKTEDHTNIWKWRRWLGLLGGKGKVADEWVLEFYCFPIMQRRIISYLIAF